MAGTLFGIPLSQPLDINGTPLSGNLLYVYLASTSTPASTFQDFGLTVINPFPLQADSSGRIPAFWVADGAYRARLTDSTGVMIYDLDNIQAIGPSTGGSGGGGGGGGSVDPAAVFQTGDPLWVPVDNIIRSGWVRLNSKTIGSATSGGTERANADTQALYEYIWATFTDSLCPVTGGRGGSAATDFTANKSIQLLDMRGRGPFGLDTMGNSAAGILTAGTPTLPGTAGGAEKQTIAQVNLPVATLTSSGLSFTLTYGQLTNASVTGAGLYVRSIGAGGNATSTDAITGSVTTPLGGSGTALTTTSPYRLGTWYIKL